MKKQAPSSSQSEASMGTATAKPTANGKSTASASSQTMQGLFDTLPTGLHAVVPASILQKDVNIKTNSGAENLSAEQALTGVVFVLHNRNASLNSQHHNRLHPYYIVYITNEGQVIINHMQEKKALDFLRKACKGHAEAFANACKVFNKKTQNGQKMKTYSSLLEKSIQSIIEVKKQKDIDSLFAGAKTTALENPIKGLDDFELVAFLVVQNG